MEFGILDFRWSLNMFARWWFQIFCYFHLYLGKIPSLTNIFQMGWNHQLEIEALEFFILGTVGMYDFGKGKIPPEKKTSVGRLGHGVFFRWSSMLGFQWW